MRSRASTTPVASNGPSRLESGNANHFSGLDRGSALDPLDIDIDSLDHRSGTRVDMGDEGEPGRGLRREACLRHARGEESSLHPGVTGEREQNLAYRGQNLGWVASLKLDIQTWVVAIGT